MRRHTPYDWTGEKVRRRQRRIRAARLGTLLAVIGLLSVAGALIALK
ncbi:hypothetical protein [Brucella pituitosa]